MSQRDIPLWLTNANEWLMGPTDPFGGGTVAPGAGASPAGFLPSPRQQAMLGLAGAMLEAGGPSLTPTSFGQAVGRGLQQFGPAMQQAQQAQLQQRMGAMQLAQAQDAIKRRKAWQARIAALRGGGPRASGGMATAPSPTMPPPGTMQTSPAAPAGPAPQTIPIGYPGAPMEAPSAPTPVGLPHPPVQPAYTAAQLDAAAAMGPDKGAEYLGKIAAEQTKQKAAAKPFAAVERATGREVLITPAQFQAQPEAYAPVEKKPIVAINQLPSPPQGMRYTKEGELTRIPGAPFKQAETTAAGFANRMVGAEQIMQRLVSRGYDPGGAFGKTLEAVGLEILAPTQRKQYKQAQEDWVRAKLREESGAVIGEEEMASEIRTYFPQVNDPPEVVEQKFRARQRATENLVKQSQGAYQEMYGETGQTRLTELNDEQREIVRQAKAKARAGGDIATIMRIMSENGVDPSYLDR